MSTLTKTLIIVSIIFAFLLIFFVIQKKYTHNHKHSDDTKQQKAEENNEPQKENEDAQPHISIALQDELDEFKNYLKNRITPEIVTEEEKHKYAHFEPKFKKGYPSFKDFESSNLYDSPDDLNYLPGFNKIKMPKEYENLPEDIKLLLFSNIFDKKYK